jgi:hypothetical protein
MIFNNNEVNIWSDNNEVNIWSNLCKMFYKKNLHILKWKSVQMDS